MVHARKKKIGIKAVIFLVKFKQIFKRKHNRIYICAIKCV